jgi:hypothetical protein
MASFQKRIGEMLSRLVPADDYDAFSLKRRRPYSRDFVARRRDQQVWFTPEEAARSRTTEAVRTGTPKRNVLRIVKGDSGVVFHTFSLYVREVAMPNGLPPPRLRRDATRRICGRPKGACATSTPNETRSVGS